MRKRLLALLTSVVRPFWGHGISKRLPFFSRLYNFIYCSINGSAIIMANYRGLKIYAQANSSIVHNLIIAQSYEEQTTLLFHEILTEGMTVLDIGANVGYYSLIAGKLVGDKGKVYAFEPCNQSYSILQKNIEANNFKNIIPIKKALTDVIGKQRLFLCDDPVGNSLVMRDDNKFEDVEVTTVDLFVNDQNISVDLIKMDVEGAEMRTLEGMKKTILNNPKLKIITEFMPQNLEKSGCAPVKFLERLMDLDFNLYLMNEEAHTHQMITRNNMNDIINTLDGKYWTLTNIYCYKEYNNNSI